MAMRFLAASEEVRDESVVQFQLSVPLPSQDRAL